LVEQQWRGGVGGGGGGQKKEAEAEVGELHFFRRVHHVAVGPEEKRCGVVDRDRDGENNERTDRERTILIYQDASPICPLRPSGFFRVVFLHTCTVLKFLFNVQVIYIYGTCIMCM
jgi:hypothetical protein